MAELVYTTVPGKISSLLTKLKGVGVPPKVTVAWLKTIGFTSSNDSSLIGVLRLVDLIDSSGIPTGRWSKYRGPHGKRALAEGLKAGYQDLYSIYPDAHEKSNAEIELVFSSGSKAGEQAIKKAVSTFKNLAAECDFSGGEQQASVSSEGVGQGSGSSDAGPIAQTSPSKSSMSPSLHIDVQVHISSDASTEQIDQIFASMAKHLYGKD